MAVAKGNKPFREAKPLPQEMSGFSGQPAIPWLPLVLVSQHKGWVAT